MKYNQRLNIWLKNYAKPTSKIKRIRIYKQIAEKKFKALIVEI